MFGGFKKSPYLCTRLQEQDSTQSYNGSRRAFSSVGLEHLPYKQRVGGSNPSTPTRLKDCNENCNPFLFSC